jgi:phage shock protein PspC (stress-responsive transcriptional regulator)
MNKVVVVNLNGSAYQLEEGGYIALRAYLDHAGTQLRENPDKAEILSDLEQAIGEKCDQFLGAHKNVVAAEEVDRILREMGPVHDPSAASGNAADAEGAQDGKGTSESAAAPKRLYQVREGEMISGVCNGFAAYFGIDVTVMRVIFVVLAFVTSGAWILVYLVMMIVIPHANTQEERAAARGLPFNAQELINGVKKKYADFSDGREARRRRRAAGAHRYERRAHSFHHHEPPRASAGYTAHVVTGLLSPVFGLVGAGLFVLFISAFISMASTGAVLGWSLPPQIPLWAGLLILVALYVAMHETITTARRATYALGGPSQARFAALDGLFWLAFCALFLWIAYLYLPAVQYFIDRLLSMWDQVSHRIMV